MKPGDALLFGDETSIELNRRLQKMWWIKGERPEIPVDSGRKRLNLIGTIDVLNHAGFFAEIKNLDAVQFFGFLKGLLRDYRIPGKIYLVLDNARTHHAKMLQSFLEKNKDRLQLVFLPPYSPDYNPIELFWRELKKDLNTNEYFETLEELRNELYAHLQQFKQPSERIASLWNAQKFFTAIKM